MVAPIVWHRPPEVVPRASLDPLDIALLVALGVPATASTWHLRMRVQEPWTISVVKIGTIFQAELSAEAPSVGARREVWDLPDTRYTRRSDGSISQDPPTVEGLAWVCRVLDAEGGVLVEDLWSVADGRYRRRLDADRLSVAKRLGRSIFDQKPWGPGRPQGRQASFSEIVDAILEFRSAGNGDPTQDDLVEMDQIPYNDVRSLQRALGDLSWQDALQEATQIEADRAAYSDKVVLRGFAYLAKADR